MSTKSRTTKNGAPGPIRPAMGPFDVEQSPARRAELNRNIEALNAQLELGNRGYFDVPTGHANGIKAAFEGAGNDEHRWHVAIVKANPTFTTLAFRADGEPEPPPGEPALALLAQVRAEVSKLLGSIPVPRTQ